MYIWSQTGKDAEARKGASRERGNRSLPFPVENITQSLTLTTMYAFLTITDKDSASKKCAKKH